MHGRTFLLFASLILPIVTTPVPGFEVSPKDETIEQLASSTIVGYAARILKREPVIEALPVEARSSIVFDTKSEVAPVAEERDAVETRAKQRPGSGWVTNPKRSEDTIEVRAKQRGGSGWNGRKRSEDNLETRAKQRGGSGWNGRKRSEDNLETRAKQRGGSGWNGRKRSEDNLETRAKQRGGSGWNGRKRSADATEA